MYRRIIAIVIAIFIVTSLVTASEGMVKHDNEDKAVRVNQIWIPMEQTALNSLISNQDFHTDQPFKIGQVWIP